MAAPHAYLGVDTGGTFTDFVLLEGETVRTHKVLSTPDAPERAILQGLADLGVGREGLRVIHGSTVATNAVLEGKGVRTAFVTNRGFADLLTIGRQARAELYNLQPGPLAPPVPPELCVETGGRLGSSGAVVEDLTAADLAGLRARLEALQPEAVAICLLFSFLDDRFERQVEAAVGTGAFVCRSSAVLPEYREYERGVATWLNAWVGPRVAGYLARLTRALAPAQVSVMQSSGETIDAAQAGGQAVRLLLSGPAGGLSGARHVAALAGRTRLLSFDMGGTSTDVALVDGATRLTSEGRIGRYPVGVPMVDLHTIGAGGGSIARVDSAGLLLVGPQSAGADPGPACYGRGGGEATVTDANLVLGRILPADFLGGRMRLDREAARAAVGRVASQLGLGVEEAAAGIVQVANELMARALRVISVQRGIDPRAMTLVCFGGAGGLHVCALAEALGMDEGRAQLARESVDPGTVRAQPSLDLRYRGQSFHLTVPWQGAAASAAAFHAAHQARYGHRLEVPVEVVNLRVGLQGAPLDLRLPTWSGRALGTRAGDEARLWGLPSPAAVWSRERLAPGQALGGAALVTDAASTTYVAPGWRARLDPWGNLVLTRPLKPADREPLCPAHAPATRDP